MTDDQEYARSAGQFKDAAAAFLLMKSQDETSRHLMINIYRRAVQAGRLVYRAIDAGTFTWLWPFGKPAEDFAYELVDAPDNASSRMRRGRKQQDHELRRVPDDKLSSSHYFAAWQKAVDTLTRMYPEAFEAGADKLHQKTWAKDEHGRVKFREEDGKRQPMEAYDEGDEASKRAWQRHRAGVYADACKLLARLAEEPSPPHVPEEPKENAIYVLGPGQRVRPIGSGLHDGTDVTPTEFELLRAFETDECLPITSAVRRHESAVWNETYNAEDVSQRRKIQTTLRRLNGKLFRANMRVEFKLSRGDLLRNRR